MVLSSARAFLSFVVLDLVGFLELVSMAYSSFCRFSSIASFSQGALRFSLGFRGICSSAASSQALTKFSYMSFAFSVVSSDKIEYLFFSAILKASEVS